MFLLALFYEIHLIKLWSYICCLPPKSLEPEDTFRMPVCFQTNLPEPLLKYAKGYYSQDCCYDQMDWKNTELFVIKKCL